MSDGNRINIGSIGDANHINIAQNQAPERTSIQFVIDPRSVERVSRGSVIKGAVAFFLSLPALALSVMSILADALGILSYFNVPLLSTRPVTCWTKRLNKSGGRWIKTQPAANSWTTCCANMPAPTMNMTTVAI